MYTLQVTVHSWHCVAWPYSLHQWSKRNLKETWKKRTIHPQDCTCKYIYMYLHVKVYARGQYLLYIESSSYNFAKPFFLIVAWHPHLERLQRRITISHTLFFSRIVMKVMTMIIGWTTFHCCGTRPHDRDLHYCGSNIFLSFCTLHL